MDARSRDELLAACLVLFGRSFEPSFLGQLQESGLRSAWRLKAFQTHPDKTTNRSAKHLLTEHFIEARRAYTLLQEYLACRSRLTELPAGQRRRHPATRTQPPRAPTHRRGPPAPTPHFPRRRLRLGEYLYHARAISFPALIAALVWQRRQRDRFCEVSRRWGYLSETEVRELLAVRRPNEQVGATARRLRLLSEFQVRTVLSFQRSRQQPIGSYFLSNGLLTATDLHQLLRRFTNHNAAFARTGALKNG